MSHRKQSATLQMNHWHKKCVQATCLASLIAAFIVANQAKAGAWVPDSGDGYFKVGYQSYQADSFFGENADLGEFTGKNLSFYGEYGLGSNTAVYGTLLSQDIEQSDAAGNASSSSGLSDLELGLRYQWQTDPFVLSTSLLVKLPYLYDEDEALPLGNGQEDVEFRVLLGKSLHPYGYVGVEAGYRVRTDAPSDEYRYLLEYGISASDNLYFRAKLDGTLSANNADVASSDTGNLSISPEFDLAKLELTIGWNFGEESRSNNKRWGVEFTYIDDLYGDNTLEGDAVQLGITRVF